MKIKIPLSFFACLILSTAITSCGGDNDNPASVAPSTNSELATQPSSNALSGLFIDGPVSGISYTCGSQKGTTDDSGKFFYDKDSICTFAVGKLEIGKASGSSIVTPVSLVFGAIDETNAQVVNLSRFLQSLDADSNTSNGISIPSDKSSQLAGTLNFSAATFDTEASQLINRLYPGRSLVSVLDASEHLRVNLIKARDGKYLCQFKGGEAGSVTVTLDKGSVSGVGYFADDIKETFNVYGAVKSSGALSLGPQEATGNPTAGGTSLPATWTGEVKMDGQASGTWKTPPGEDYQEGTWSCVRQ